MEDTPLSTPHPLFKPTKYLVCVSNSPESRVALKLACFKAQASGGLVDILHVIPPADFQSLSAIAEQMREEQQQEAESLLTEVADEAYTLCGVRPSLIIKEGQIGEAIVAAALEDHELDMLVIGAAENAKGKGTLITWLAAQLGTKLPLPLLLVPGNLTDQQLMALV